jgi:hypothetical protein
MCADKNADNSQFLWEDEPMVHTHNLTLGQMIDGFRQLSESDKQAFMLVSGLIARTAASAVAAPVPLVAAVAPAPGASEPIVAQGPQASQMARQGVQVSTRDPKTGKVYRVVAPTTRSNNFVGLENNSLRARQALNAYMKRNGYEYNQETKVLLRNKVPVATPPEEYTQLVERVKASILEVKGYKQAHPEEFRPPTQRVGKARIADQGTSGTHQ